MFAIVSILIVLSLTLLFGRLAALALTVTGIPTQIARFQARSALTGSGFTTMESEEIVSHPVRRRIVMLLMLVGNLGAAGLIASLIGGFAGISSVGGGLRRAVILLIGLVALFYLSKSPWADRQLSRGMLAILRRFTDLEVRDEATLLRLHGEYSISELQVQRGDWMAGRMLAELDLPHEGVLVLSIINPDGRYLGAPTGGDKLSEGDVVVLYGRSAVIEDLDDRSAGGAGDSAHVESVVQHREVVDSEHADTGAAESAAADERTASS
jgi:hypothetical protein